MEVATVTEHEVRPFAAVVDELCRAGRSGGRAYSNVEVANAVGVRPSYIAALRKGHRDNPKLRMIYELAEYLDVHPAYFVGGRQDRLRATLPRRTFADKLGALFALVHPPDEPELTTNAVMLTIRRHSQELVNPSWTISAATLDGLRTGANDNPRLIHIFALSRAFGAPPAYFLDDELAARIEEQLEMHRTMRSLGVDTLILRASQQELKPSIRARILEALTSALRPDQDSGTVDQPVPHAHETALRLQQSHNILGTDDHDITDQ
jgi:transcriptional regulator with XRE-family HTH domain